MHYMHFLVCILPGTASFQECSKEKTEPNALWRAHIQSKGVKELPTDSPYKPCFNKPLPPPHLPFTPFDSPNRGKISIYGPVPVLDCCSQASLHPLSPFILSLPPSSAPFIPAKEAVWSFMATEPFVHHLYKVV